MALIQIAKSNTKKVVQVMSSSLILGDDVTDLSIGFIVYRVRARYVIVNIYFLFL
ncbi:MAG: hypothetical protein JWR38_265 [Mucilaginibacter sp.]|nr:hypothetical protein [Mucilaginibacter sp.]